MVFEIDTVIVIDEASKPNSKFRFSKNWRRPWKRRTRRILSSKNALVFWVGERLKTGSWKKVSLRLEPCLLFHLTFPSLARSLTTAGRNEKGGRHIAAGILRVVNYPTKYSFAGCLIVVDCSLNGTNIFS